MMLVSSPVHLAQRGTSSWKHYPFAFFPSRGRRRFRSLIFPSSHVVNDARRFVHCLILFSLLVLYSFVFYALCTLLILILLVTGNLTLVRACVNPAPLFLQPPPCTNRCTSKVFYAPNWGYSPTARFCQRILDCFFPAFPKVFLSGRLSGLFYFFSKYTLT